jgi:ElaB/YqjD/DUF883 family membrane-anchored ribosome-binding protein
MAQETLTNRISTGEHDAIAAQIAALRSDFVKLAGSVQASATSNGTAFAKDVTEGLNEAAGYIGRKGHAADLRVETAVAANPYLALGLAAGIGLLVGAMTRR